jgi:hypothetical protein
MSIKGIWRGKSRFETIAFSCAPGASEADHKSPDELKQQYSSASILKIAVWYLIVATLSSL